MPLCIGQVHTVCPRPVGSNASELVRILAQLMLQRMPIRPVTGSGAHEQLLQELQQPRWPVDDDVSLLDECWWGLGGVHCDA